jgi:transposase-like protein
MENHKTSRKFSPEVRERAVRMVLEHSAEPTSQWAAITSIAAKIGCTAQTLHTWVRQAERDQGLRAGPTTDEREAVLRDPATSCRRNSLRRCAKISSCRVRR